MSLSEILKQINKVLIEKDEIRQEIQTSMRKATRLSKQAIFQIHKNKHREAIRSLVKAEVFFNKLEEISAKYPDLRYMGIVNSAYEEYSEASVLLHLIQKGQFISNEEVQAPRVPYVLSLADVIGELRRRSLDSLRKKEKVKAEKILEQMETIFYELMNLDEINFLIPGLRRKCDVSRRVVEATRGDITLALGKIGLENSIKELKKTLEDK